MFPNKLILSPGDAVRELMVMGSGSCQLFGFFSDSKNARHRVHVVTLPQKSWFGEY